MDFILHNLPGLFRIISVQVSYQVFIWVVLKNQLWERLCLWLHLIDHSWQNKHNMQDHFLLSKILSIYPSLMLHERQGGKHQLILRINPDLFMVSENLYDPESTLCILITILYNCQAIIHNWALICLQPCPLKSTKARWATFISQCSFYTIHA